MGTSISNHQLQAVGRVKTSTGIFPLNELFLFVIKCPFKSFADIMKWYFVTHPTNLMVLPYHNICFMQLL